MNDELNISRSRLLEILRSIRPVVFDPVMTYDMGMECDIATKHGVVYRGVGMFLGSASTGGDWPIRKLSPSDADFLKERDTFFLCLDEDELLFTDVEGLETAFIKNLPLDKPWEEMSNDELEEWQEKISTEGIDLLAMSDLYYQR